MTSAFCLFFLVFYFILVLYLLQSNTLYFVNHLERFTYHYEFWSYIILCIYILYNIYVYYIYIICDVYILYVYYM